MLATLALRLAVFNSSSLSYNTVARQWLRILVSGDGFYYSLSPDLIQLETAPGAVLQPPLDGCLAVRPTGSCRVPVAQVDPASSSRNFDTSGAKAYLYYTQFNTEGCQETLNRDLVPHQQPSRPGRAFALQRVTWRSRA